MLTQPAGRFPWIALAAVFAALSFTLTVYRAVTSGLVPWTEWAVPALVLGNVAVLLFGWWQTRPRVLMIFSALSIGFAMVIVVALARSL